MPVTLLIFFHNFCLSLAFFPCVWCMRWYEGYCVCMYYIPTLYSWASLYICNYNYCTYSSTCLPLVQFYCYSITYVRVMTPLLLWLWMAGIYFHLPACNSVHLRMLKQGIRLSHFQMLAFMFTLFFVKFDAYQYILHYQRPVGCVATGVNYPQNRF